MRFDLTDLRLFLSILETGSITRGAAQANLSLPSASARIRGMEETVGLPLLERGRRGVESTPAGDTLAHHARLVLRQVEQMQGELGEHATGVKAHIRLWANTVALTEFLPDVLGVFLAGRPLVCVNIKERLSAETVKAVSGGLADVGIVSDAVAHGALQTFPFATDRLVLAVPRAHPLAAQRRIAFQEVVRHDFIGLSEGSPMQAHVDAQALLAGQALSFRARMRTFDGVCRMVAHGVGFGIVPERAAQRFRGTPGIRAIRFTDAWATRQLLLCVRQLDALSLPARELVRHLSAGAGKRGAAAA